MTIQIKPMSLQTVDAVAQIEAECFSQPWSQDAFVAELSNPAAVTFVADVDGEIAGFINLGVVLDEATVNNIAVKQTYRRRGIGRALLTAAINYCQNNRLNMLMLEVRQSNRAAIALYERFGFQAVGIRKRFYDQPEEDAVLMNKNIIAAE
ncbi:MAG: ribosomal protein S18-alanine N-acetyltransferase [Clostridiales bacterium]|nr:ribosomal protein S18-alanine N-acetyltransferase [Clostridiales bacterium]